MRLVHQCAFTEHGGAAPTAPPTLRLCFVVADVSHLATQEPIMLSKPHDNRNRDGALIVRKVARKSHQTIRNVFANADVTCRTIDHRGASHLSRSNNELAIERGIHITAKGRIIRAVVSHKGIASQAGTNWPIGITLHAKGRNSR